MIDGGIAYLIDHGLGVGTERATFKSVFDYILDKRDIKLCLLYTSPSPRD